ncbi:MAG TPA: glycosyltransferase family 4 protein [Bryobacteraceae bacterium]|nr:glycosyltransferase family 4 protein [Bryobacteraceae bacterium]
MRIFAFTAGAANMYCGSCLRDNALAAAMKADGHDVILMPVYTPTLSDEENVSDAHVFFGGISVYLQQYSSFFRKTPWFLDKLWDSQLALKAASRRSIPVNPRFLGEMTVAMLEGETGPQKKEFEKMAHYLQHLDNPDLSTLPNSLVIAMAKPIKRVTKKPVYVTLQGEDLFLEGLQEPYRSRSLALLRDQIGDADGYIAVSEFCGRLMGSYLNIPKDRLHVVPLGVNTSDLTMRKPQIGVPFTIGYFARITPEKSLHQLCEAYRWMRQEGGLPPSRLEAAGYIAPEQKEYLEIIQKQMKDWGLDGEFHYHGPLDREHKVSFLRRLDVLSVPSLYAETKGLYLLEAMACGVPVVQPRHGSFPEMIEKTGGGLLAEADNPVSFGQAIMRLYRDPALREELSQRAYNGVREHYTVQLMAQRAAAVYRGAGQRSAMPVSLS